MRNGNAYDWLFRFNPYQQKWLAVKRSNYNKLFSNIGSSDVLKSSNINTLLDIINRTDGNPTKLRKLISKGNEGKNNRSTSK